MDPVIQADAGENKNTAAFAISTDIHFSSVTDLYFMWPGACEGTDQYFLVGLGEPPVLPCDPWCPACPCQLSLRSV